MNTSRHAMFFALASVFLIVAGCSSSSSKTRAAAKGSAKAATTKQPPSAPKPAKKAGGNVTGNVSSAAPVESSPTCTAEEDGLAACADTFAVFCSAQKVYALDCAAAFGGTCGELDDGTVDCIVEE